jgi:hypothetical protein
MLRGDRRDLDYIQFDDDLLAVWYTTRADRQADQSQIGSIGTQFVLFATLPDDPVWFIATPSSHSQLSQRLGQPHADAIDLRIETSADRRQQGSVLPISHVLLAMFHQPRLLGNNASQRSQAGER